MITLAQREAMRQTDRQWAVGLVDQFPRSWQSRLLGVWRRDHRADHRQGNLSLLERVTLLADSARGGVRADATDHDICTVAERTASDFAARLRAVEARARGAAGAVLVRLQAFYARHVLRQRGLLDMWPNTDRAAALARMKCPRFWRRQLRKLHARTVEACAISIGLVRKTAGLYCSDDAVKRSKAQDARNAGVLESVTAVNEQLQAYKLAELAATGTANQEIRRQELLTRIAGFELIAKDCGHLAYMVTVTCPSRFHSTTTLTDGRVVDNRKWDESLPSDAQAYLTKQWGRARAAAKRMGLDWYGFRIAEPQQDGCPHWHLLLFMPHAAECVDSGVLMRAIFRRYFLENESPTERGAEEYRLDFQPIDWARGSAVGYVIKYISKNIDGHGVGLDLFGNDAITSSQRVRAWAKNWRIRQFQQLGGAPVSLWRELRRIHPDNVPEQAPEPLRAALSAMNVGKLEPGIQALAWAKFTKAAGGVTVKRADLQIKLIKEQTGELGRYGDLQPARPVGVFAHGVELFRNHIHEAKPSVPAFKRQVLMGVGSERSEWVIGARDEAIAIAVARQRFQPDGAAVRPRIHVNNCTRPDYSRVSEFAPRKVMRPKLGRVKRWEPSPGRPPGIPERNL